MARRSSDIIVGLDIGTTKIAAVVGEMADERPRHHRHRHPRLARSQEGGHRQHRLDGGGHQPGHRSRPRACRAARSPRSTSGIAGGHIKGINSTGTVAVKDKEVRTSRRGQGAGAGPRDRLARRPPHRPRAAPGVQHRRPGRRARAARHVWRAPGGARAHRHRRRGRHAERHQVLPAAATSRCSTSCSSRWPRARRCWRRTKRAWASP